MTAPWRDADRLRSACNSRVMVTPMARTILARMWRTISPGFFTALGVPISGRPRFQRGRRPESRAGRDRQRDSRGAHVSWSGSDQSACLLDRSRARVPSRHGRAKRRDSRSPHRIIGVAADVDDEHIVPTPTATIYGTFADSPCSAVTSSSTPPRIPIRL